ncbi:MAG: GNAT family N-acetyltransferase [Planctomycetes bacterium]|nr:GNAT family N-acetyltransferase [Planctomycetota bacterium]
MQLSPEQIRLVPAGPTLRVAAARRLLGTRQGEALWLLKRLDEEGWSPDDLWCAADPSDRVLAAGLISHHPGRTASLSLSPCVHPQEVPLAARLLDRMVQALEAAGGPALAQGMTDAEDPLAGLPFQQAGFQDLAILACMERMNRRNPPMPELPPGVSLESVNHDRELMQVLRASYEQTLDCPGLAELRRDEDILDGHRRGRPHDPELWTLMRRDGQAIGAALLQPSLDGERIELAYLGLAKSARGKGLGAMLLDASLHRAASRPQRLISLAVDERNEPALRLYRSRGFRTTVRRRAFARPLRSST